MTDALTELRLALARNGYRPVPVAGAHLAIRSAGKRPLMKGWETICATAGEDEIARWSRAQRNCTNTGLLCGEIVGVDIDVPMELLAAEVEAMACEMLGATPCKRIGQAPKLLLTFRAERPFDKVQTPELVLTDNTVVRAEVLASGQQFVGFGMHPGTKADYFWPDRSPLDVPVTDLPIVTAAQCAAFIDQAEARLRRAGSETRAERREIEREGRKAARLGRDAKPSREIVAEALAHVPNDDLPYDNWVKIGLALYAALGSEARDLWENWSAQSAKNEASFTADKWESFAAVRSVTVGTLFWLAQQNGWRAERPRRIRAARPMPETADDGALAQDNRRLIRIYAGFMPETIDKAELALLGTQLGFYQRGSMVVRPAMVPVAISDGR